MPALQALKQKYDVYSNRLRKALEQCSNEQKNNTLFKTAMINLKLISSIRGLRNREFMHLYLQMVEIAERYALATEDKVLMTVLGLMQGEVEKVKLLDVKLNAPSDIIKQRDIVHGYIKNEVRRIRILLQSNKLSNLPNESVNANYAFPRLDKLMRLQNVSSVGTTSVTISFIRDTIETDAKLENALVEMDLMKNVEMLYKWQVEFNEHNDEQNDGKIARAAIDKKTIKTNAARALTHLFNVIEMQYAETEDARWVEMAEEIVQLTKQCKGGGVAVKGIIIGLNSQGDGTQIKNAD